MIYDVIHIYIYILYICVDISYWDEDHHPPSTHPPTHAPRPLVERSNFKHSTNAGNTLATKQQLLPLGNQICPPYVSTSVLRTRTLASTCPTPKLNSQTRSPETGNHNNDPLTVIIQETALLSRPSSRKSCARERGFREAQSFV